MEMPFSYSRRADIYLGLLGFLGWASHVSPTKKRPVNALRL